MKILISTGIYPPKIGGPSQYAKNMATLWSKMGHVVVVKTYNIENKLPTGIRHLWFFLKIIPNIIRSDFIFALDTFSVGFPSVLASKIFNKKIIIRTGGDFLWEGYVERTSKKVLFRNFYKDEVNNFSLKEKIIFRLTKWTLNNSSKLVFSTKWQRDIFVSAYDIDPSNVLIVENYYGEKDNNTNALGHTFVGSTRELKWKNIDTLKSVFDKLENRIPPDFGLLTKTMEFSVFMDKIKECYAVILVSLGDISPNIILDAIRFNKPFICTKEVGIFDRIKDIGIFVDPLNEKEIEDAILKLLNKDEYEIALQKVKSFSFVHSWEDMANEYINIYNSLK